MKGLRIVGNLFSVNSEAIIILAHGFTNDKSSNGRFEKLAKGVNEIGYDALAIDFTGSGESEDAPLTAFNQLEDLNSAIRFVQKNGYKKIALFGNSFGSLACLRCNQEEILTMVLTGPLTDCMYYKWDDFFDNNQLKQLESKGYFYTKDERKHKITRQTLQDFKEVNQKELKARLRCPILILHGNHEQDNEELLLLEHSKRFIQLLDDASRIKIIDGGRHGFRKKWDFVVKSACDWYKNQME